jgi:hypothetical protein
MGQSVWDADACMEVRDLRPNDGLVPDIWALALRYEKRKYSLLM